MLKKTKYETGRSATKLQVVHVPYIPNEICSGDESDYSSDQLSNNMMCAGNLTHGIIDSCTGDSGGELCIHIWSQYFLL